MAISPTLLSSLSNPAYMTGLYDVAQQVGSAPGVMQANREIAQMEGKAFDSLRKGMLAAPLGDLDQLKQSSEEIDKLMPLARTQKERDFLTSRLLQLDALRPATKLQNQTNVANKINALTNTLASQTLDDAGTERATNELNRLTELNPAAAAQAQEIRRDRQVADAEAGMKIAQFRDRTVFENLVQISQNNPDSLLEARKMALGTSPAAVSKFDEYMKNLNETGPLTESQLQEITSNMTPEQAKIFRQKDTQFQRMVYNNQQKVKKGALLKASTELEDDAAINYHIDTFMAKVRGAEGIVFKDKDFVTVAGRNIDPDFFNPVFGMSDDFIDVLNEVNDDPEKKALLVGYLKDQFVTPQNAEQFIFQWFKDNYSEEVSSAEVEGQNIADKAAEAAKIMAKLQKLYPTASPRFLERRFNELLKQEREASSSSTTPAVSNTLVQMQMQGP